MIRRAIVSTPTGGTRGLTALPAVAEGQLAVASAINLRHPHGLAGVCAGRLSSVFGLAAHLQPGRRRAGLDYRVAGYLDWLSPPPPPPF